jgi:hypothetical protein
LTNVPILTGAAEGDNNSTLLAMAAAHVAYEAHRVASNHNNPDSTALPTLSGILEIHREFLAQLRVDSPTAPSNENPGVPLLVAIGGAKA